MAIAFDAATGSSTTGTSLTYSHTCSGSNRALIVHYVTDTSNDLVTGVTYNGVAMSFIGRVQSPSSRWTGIYYLAAPATGANNVVISASGSAYLEASSASYTGVKQTGNPEANASNTGASVTSLSGTVTTITDNAWLVMGGHAAAGSQAAGTGTTRRHIGTVSAFFDSNGAKSPTGSYSLQQTHASTNCSVYILSLEDAGAGETISLTGPVTKRVFQRSGSTGSISISGSVTGSTEDIEASFNGGAYATIATAVAPGSFSGTLSGQAQGQGTLTVRKKTTTTTSTTVADIGIGDIFVVGGDSISEGRGTNAQSYSHATLKAVTYRQDDAFAFANDPIDTGTSSGSHWPLLATQIMSDQSVPVLFITTGTGSTDVYTSGNDEWAKPNSAYTEMTSQVTSSGVNSVRAVLMHLGPNAVVAASTPTQAAYNAALDTLASNIAADVVGAPKLHLGIFGETSPGSPPDRTAALNNCRAAIIEALGDNANIKPGPCLIDLNYSDGVHPQSDADLATVAKRWWVAINESLYSGSGGRGPRLSSAQWNAGRTQLTVVFDRTLKTGLTFGAGAWRVLDNGTPMTVSSVAYHGTDTSAVVLTMSAAASGPAGTSTASLGHGDTAVGVVIPTSDDITMPSGAAITIPAEPFYAQAVSEFSSGQPGRSLSLVGVG